MRLQVLFWRALLLGLVFEGFVRFTAKCYKVRLAEALTSGQQLSHSNTLGPWALNIYDTLRVKPCSRMHVALNQEKAKEQGRY